MITAQEAIEFVCAEVRDLLIEKNRKYGNSALEPMRVFSKASSREQLLVRMDDKLSRIKNSQSDDEEDATLDLLGYLVLERVQRKLLQAQEDLDNAELTTPDKLVRPGHQYTYSPGASFVEIAERRAAAEARMTGVTEVMRGQVILPEVESEAKAEELRDAAVRLLVPSSAPAPGQVDPDEASDGYVAVLGVGTPSDCARCQVGTKPCMDKSMTACTPQLRKDGQSVYFVLKEPK